MRTDLISRNKLHTTLQRQAHRVIDDREYVIRDAVLEKITMAPSVDAVEVVRCRECEYRKTSACPMRSSGSGIYIGHGMYDEGSDKTTDNGFCHKGIKQNWEG